ncbi:MAG: hypothetical protein RBR66_04140, partial [Candidatus Izemoplasmatales bacterium]|nr:hypothetical protein [Candidatus Izemoplasmatales bacterium]
MNNISKFGYIKHTLVILTSMVFLFLNIGFFVKVTEAVPNQPQGFDPSRYVEFDGQFDWDDALTPKTESDQYISYSDYRSTICTAGASTCDTTKTIRIETAEELYRFSVDVSFAEVYITGNPTENVKLSDTKIEEILDQDYVLGQDIDYSVMKSKTFIPIGFLFADTLGNIYQRYFTGTFDGQGFEITNLYLSGHQYLIYEDNNNPESVEIAMTEYYGMFNYNAGLIKNIGFIDMYTEMLQMNTELTKMTNIVGFNMPDPESWNEGTEDFDVYGSVENIYLIDRRVNVEEAGIRYLVGTSSEDFQAAGIVHTNAANFENSYVATRVVVNANFIDKFTIEPVVYTNTGSVIINLGEVDQEEIIVTGQSSNLYYDSSIYLTGDIDIDDDQIIDFTVKTPNSLATGISTIDLETGNFTYEPSSFYFYPDDGYPILKGLDYVGGVYQINDALDLALFSKLLNKNTELNGEEFSRSDFILTADIDMSILSPGSYEVPHKIFYGTLSGANGSEDVLTDNFYIYGLDILGGYSVNNEHYVGLFSRLGSGAKISDINFSQSTIAFSNTDDIYSQTFYMGAIAGKMVDATIENVIVDINYNLGNEALSRTYLGGVVGQASGVINKVSNNGDINFGSHTFTEAQAINAKYYIGGIAGSALSTDRLSIYDSVNNGNITGFSTSSDIYLSSGVTDINVYIGGITGYLENTTSAIHDLVYVSNKGNINVGSVKERTGVEAYQYVGGVFGTLVGKAPVLEDETGLRFANLYNEGNIIHSYLVNTADVKSAGIGISKTNEDVEYALLFNHGTFNYTGSVSGQFDFTTMICDVSDTAIDITLSRLYNYGNLTYDSNIYTNVSPFYTSVGNRNT